MKLNKLSALCALACAGITGQAMAAMTAAEQAIVNDANTNGRVVYLAGASAVQKGFDAIIGTLFSGTPIRFTDSASRNYEAVAGPLAAAAGTWAAGTNVVFLYRVKGGSGFGVFPVARNTQIDSMDVTSTACGASGAGTVASPYFCTVSANSRAPDAGISDVAPVMFTSPINTEGETAASSLTGAELAVLTSTPVYALAFGLPVTATVPSTVSFNRSVVAAIMTGNIGTWDKVDATLPADDILICRRTPGSGTQAVNNLYYGNYPCDQTGAAANFPADRDASGAWNATARTFTVGAANTGGLVVIENNSSGDVRKCLDAADAGGSYTTGDRDGNPVTVTITGAHKAIGVLSADSLSNSVATAVAGQPIGGSNAKWQFRSLDGAGTYTWDNTAIAPVATGTGKFPTLANFIDGTWDIQGWESFNVPSRTTGNKAALLANFVTKAQNPTVLAGISSLKNVAAAIPGGLYSGAQVLRTAYVNGNQCSPLTRNF